MFAGFVLSSLLVLGPAAAGPIVIDECSLVKAGSFEHSVRIRFHNTSDRTATRISFEVRNGPHQITIQDHGKFAPGVPIDHVLSTPTWELYHAQANTCVVTNVHFDNGSSWSPAHHG